MLGFRKGTYSNQWFYSIEFDRHVFKANMRDVIISLKEKGVQAHSYGVNS